MAWKLEFDAKRLEGKDKKSSNAQKKLTGRELFMENSKLNESDLQFISGKSLLNTFCLICIMYFISLIFFFFYF